MATATLDPKLEENTVAELKDLADEMGIDVPSHANKDEIIKAIKKAQANPGTEAAPEQEAEVTPLVLTGPLVTLPLADVVADAYGIGKKYNITLADIVSLGANLQGNFLLDTLPAGEIVQYGRIKHSVAVAGPGITGCTAQLGDQFGGGSNFGTAFNVFTAPGGEVLSTFGGLVAPTGVGYFSQTNQIYLTLIATGANLSVATAGAISVWLRYVVIE